MVEPSEKGLVILSYTVKKRLGEPGNEKGGSGALGEKKKKEGEGYR